MVDSQKALGYVVFAWNQQPQGGMNDALGGNGITSTPYKTLADAKDAAQAMFTQAAPAGERASPELANNANGGRQNQTIASGQGGQIVQIFPTGELGIVAWYDPTMRQWTENGPTAVQKQHNLITAR